MQEFAKPIPVVTLLVGIGLAMFGQYPLAVVAFLAFIGSLAIGQMRQGAGFRESDPSEVLDPDGRARYAKVRRLATEIEAIFEKHRDSTVTRMLGKEAREEVERIRRQVASALVHRAAIRKALAGRSMAEIEVAKLREKADAALTPEEKASLAAALEARQMELEHYSEAEQSLAKIDREVQQAEAALSEMKARFEVGVTVGQAEVATPLEEIRDTIGRMKAISVSYDEADEMLRDRDF